MNLGVKLPALRREFGRETVAHALPTVARLVEEGLLTSEGKTIRLTAQGRLLSNEVFQQFLGSESAQNLDPRIGLNSGQGLEVRGPALAVR